MFGLKKKRDMDFEDIRSGVLSQPSQYNEPDFPRSMPQPPEFTDVTRPQRYDDRYDDRPQKFNDPPGFNSVDVRQGDRERNYDVMDKLNMIESQLAAIRSQTETINERLKNMERLLPKRY